MRRTERLFAIAEYLRGRRTGTTAEALAERFGVTIRTIYRDLESLRAAEMPIQAERGRGGGYALDRSYSLPPINLTAREAAVLIAAGDWLTQMRVLPFVETMNRAIDKIRGALDTTSQRRLLDQLDELQFVGVPAAPSDPGVRAAVEQAWFESQPLLISYHGADDVVSDRRIRIRQLVMDRSMTLLNADDLDKGEPRQFRLHRILKARVLSGGHEPNAPHPG